MMEHLGDRRQLVTPSEIWISRYIKELEPTSLYDCALITPRIPYLVLDELALRSKAVSVVASQLPFKAASVTVLLELDRFA